MLQLFECMLVAAWGCDVFRLAALNALDAREAGAELFSHTEVEELLVRDRTVYGVRARDVIEGNSFEVEAGVVVNAGAFSHSSLALRDAFSATSLPFVEIHLSNIYAREPERRHSMLASSAIGLVCGFGAQGYEFALRGLVTTLRSRGV